VLSLVLTRNLTPIATVGILGILVSFSIVIVLCSYPNSAFGFKSSNPEPNSNPSNPEPNSNPSNQPMIASSTVGISPGSSSPGNSQFFVPDALTIPKGTTVTWTNNDDTLHTVTSGSAEEDNPGNIFDSSYLTNGKSYNRKFTNAGEFDYFCTLHPYMKGKVIVN